MCRAGAALHCLKDSLSERAKDDNSSYLQKTWRRWKESQFEKEGDKWHYPDWETWEKAERYDISYAGAWRYYECEHPKGRIYNTESENSEKREDFVKLEAQSYGQGQVVGNSGMEGEENNDYDQEDGNKVQEETNMRGLGAKASRCLTSRGRGSSRGARRERRTGCASH